MNLKKTLSILAAVIVVISACVTNAGTATVTIDGAKLETSAPPVIEDGRVLVPMRSVFEALGAEVDWNDSLKQVTAKKDGTVIKLKIGSNEAEINGEKKSLDTEAKIINNYTMIPLRFVAEGLNCAVEWNSYTKTAMVTTDGEKPKHLESYKVVRVVDGDTFVINYGGKEEKVRMIGIDTPESVHPDSSKNTEAGKKASEYTKNLLEGKTVDLEFDVQQRDKYGRLLAYVYLDGEMVNKTLLSEGLAKPATFPPNVKYVDELKDAALRVNSDEKSSFDTAVKTEGDYIGNISSKKLHKPDCRAVKNMADYNKVYFDSVEDAEDQGYEACGICHPF